MRGIALAAVALVLVACAAPRRVIEDGEPVTAFTGVTLISEYGREQSVGRTVAIRGDRIIAIAPDNELILPATARIIDGAGYILAPGVADMHAHYVNPDVGPLFLANSVTTVRNPSGGPNAVSLIAAIEAGEKVGPFMYASGEVIDGPGSFWGPDVAVPDVAGVRARVQADAAAGFHAVKFYNRLTPEQFAAGVEEARRHSVQVYAHVPYAMTLEQVLALRIDSVEHFDAFDRSLGGQGETALARWASVNAERYAPLAAAVRDSGVWNTPTLIASIAPPRAFADLSAAEAAPEMRYADAGLMAFWHSFRQLFIGNSEASVAYREAQRGHANRVATLSALREVGAPVLIGTDAPGAFAMYGFSVHEEFGFFRDAGYSNTEILRIATIEAARFLGEEGEFGIVQEGARADLLLLAANPENDLAVLRSPVGVMAAGRWYAQNDLAAMLAEIAERAAISREGN